MISSTVIFKLGFDYRSNAVLKRFSNEEDFNVIPMKWGFIPHYLSRREHVLKNAQWLL